MLRRSLASLPKPELNRMLTLFFKFFRELTATLHQASKVGTRWFSSMS